MERFPEMTSKVTSVGPSDRDRRSWAGGWCWNGTARPGGARAGPAADVHREVQGWRSWPPTTPRRMARRARCCAARACTPATSWSGGGPATPARWPRWRRRAAASGVTRRPSGSPAWRREAAAGAGAGQGPLRGGCAGKTARALGDALRERGHRAEVDAVTDRRDRRAGPEVGVRAACEAVGAAQAGYYRRHRQSPAPQRPAPIPHRRAAPAAGAEQAERQAILDVLHSDRFVDLAPAEVWATLLDEGVYLGLDLDVLPAAAPGRGEPGAAPAGHPPGHRETGAGRHRAEPGVVLGHHQAARAGEVDLLLPVRDLGHLLPLRRRLDGRQPRVRRAGRGADPPDLRQAGHRRATS